MLPTGIVMGIPLPTSIRLLRLANEALVPWAWSINGALSVVGATLAVFIAMYWGFSTTLLSGGICYIVAASLIALQGGAPHPRPR